MLQETYFNPQFCLTISAEEIKDDCYIVKCKSFGELSNSNFEVEFNLQSKKLEMSKLKKIVFKLLGEILI